MSHDGAVISQQKACNVLGASDGVFSCGICFEAAPANGERERGSLGAFEYSTPPEFDSWYTLSPRSWPESQSSLNVVVKSWDSLMFGMPDKYTLATYLGSRLQMRRPPRNEGKNLESAF